MAISHRAESAETDMPSLVDRRLPSVSLEEVLTACRTLETEGVPVTRRSVRDRLGRGSMTTIHNGVSLYESQRVPETPKLDLTAADREVISDLGAKALAVAEERVQSILAERDASLRLLIDAAEARATDAIAAADALVIEAEGRALGAETEKSAAVIDRDAAKALAEEAERRALRLDGQTMQLLADKAAVEARATELGDNLATARTRAEVESAGREQAEARTRALETELAGVRAEYAARKQEDADDIAKLRQTLAVEQARLAEMTHQRDAVLASVQDKERELEHRKAELSQATVTAAQAQTTLAAGEQTIALLSDDLAARQTQIQQLLAAANISANGVTGLREEFSCTMAAVEGRLAAQIVALREDVARRQADRVTSGDVN